MRAWILRRYGSVDDLELRDVPMPTFRDEHELLVRVRHSSVNPADRHNLRPPVFLRGGQGFLRPKEGRIGLDLAGRVEGVGTAVRGIQVGDEVFGVGRGAFGEFAVADETQVATPPARLSSEQAAAVPIAATTALQALRDHANVGPGQRVLVNGAAGGVGTFAVQIARALGAEVSAVCSTRNVALVQSLGAIRVFDYTREDFTRSGERYDVILDMQVNHSLRAFRRALKPGGLLLVVGAGQGSITRILLGLIGRTIASKFVGPRTKFFIAKVRRDDLVVLAEMLQDGRVTPVIDHRYPLDHVPDALRELIGGHARGKIVVTV
ncbi:MAG: NAD(P)-dependent alcohol dehydrogenase [Thermoplasmata archaeon]|nr:NAD(P)-dependent alcohol dehydrogenase [Thermoplasmata archaeon]